MNDQRCTQTMSFISAVEQIKSIDKESIDKKSIQKFSRPHAHIHRIGGPSYICYRSTRVIRAARYRLNSNFLAMGDGRGGGCFSSLSLLTRQVTMRYGAT
jgi:hypothetical protein